MWPKLPGKKKHSTGAAESPNIFFFFVGKTDQVEFVFVLWGPKTAFRVLCFYFPMAVGLRLTPLPSEALRCGLQAKLPGEHLEKMKIRPKTFCFALALPALMVGGSLHPTQIFQASLGFVCAPPNICRDIF